MAVSGSKDFELDVADYVEEAFERCGLELRTGYDLKTANRSLNLMLAEWANRGLNQWTINQKSLAMVKDTTSYTIDTTNSTATIDVLDVFIRETIGGVATDVPLSRMSRSEYANMSTKATTGKPNQYFVDKVYLALGHDRVDRLSEKQLNLLNNALYRLKASKSVFDITLEEIVGQYELVTEHISPRSLEIAVENYQRKQKMN